MPRFSILTSVYNTVDYLEESVNSVISQSFDDFEYLIVDDGSTDGCFEKLIELSKNDKRIHLYQNKVNCGPIKGITKLFSLMKGDYAVFLDSDDYLDSNTLKLLNGYLKGNKWDMLFFGYKKFDSATGKIIFETNDIEEEYHESNIGDLLIKLSMDNNYNGLPRKCIKKSICKSCNIDESKYSIKRGNDKLISAELYQYIKDCKIIPDKLYFYRENPNGLTNSAFSNYYIETRDKYQMHLLINNSPHINSYQKEKYKCFELKQFKAQLFRISNLKININKKIELFNDVKKDEYYLKVLDNLLKDCNIKRIKIYTDLFNKNEYMRLIWLCKFNKFVTSIIHKRDLKR